MSLKPDQSNPFRSQVIKAPEPFPPGNTNEVSEAVIWDNFKSGSEKALALIYSRYVKSLYNYGRQFTSNHELVRDNIQDLFVELIRNKEKLGHTNSIKFYLYKSLRRKLVRSLQKQTKVFSTDNFEDHGAFLVSISPELTLLRSQLTQEQKKLLERSINALTASQREAILLYFYEGLSYIEITEVMAIGKVKSTRALLYRAIASMAEFLAPYKSKLLPAILLHFILQ